jgi:hypothetical protein
MRIMVVTLLACGFLTGCGQTAGPQADDLDAFLAAGFDDVTVYAIEPLSPSASPPSSTSGSAHFHQYPIRKQVLITDPDEGRKLASEVSVAMRERAEPAKCFDPHHALRVRKGDIYFDLVICYGCNQVELWGASYAGKIVSSSDRSQAALDAALKRGKP